VAEDDPAEHVVEDLKRRLATGNRTIDPAEDPPFLAGQPGEHGLDLVARVIGPGGQASGLLGDLGAAGSDQVTENVVDDQALGVVQRPERLGKMRAEDSLSATELAEGLKP
jgi:hypothetical protein